MIVYPRDSRERRLRAFVRQADTMRLFVGNTVPTPDTDAAAFAEPEARTGYAPAKLAGAGWRLEPAGPALRATYGPVRFAFGGVGETDVLPAATVRGYFVVDRDGRLLWSETFQGGPFRILRREDAVEIRVELDVLDLDEQLLAESR